MPSRGGFMKDCLTFETIPIQGIDIDVWVQYCRESLRVAFNGRLPEEPIFFAISWCPKGFRDHCVLAVFDHS